MIFRRRTILLKKQIIIIFRVRLETSSVMNLTKRETTSKSALENKEYNDTPIETATVIRVPTIPKLEIWTWWARVRLARFKLLIGTIAKFSHKLKRPMNRVRQIWNKIIITPWWSALLRTPLTKCEKLKSTANSRRILKWTILQNKASRPCSMEPL